MKILKYMFILLVTVLSIHFASAAQQLHYVGFNTLNSKDKTNSRIIFDNYLHQLAPIMLKYDMNLQIFDVSYGGSDKLTADVITVGSVRDMETFQAFFADPQLQKILPLLDKALGQHEVIFTSQSIAKTGDDDRHTLLSLFWLKGDNDQLADAQKSIASSINSIKPIFHKYGMCFSIKLSSIFKLS